MSAPMAANRKTVVLTGAVDSTDDRSVAVTSAADVAFYTPGQTIEVLRWGFMVTTEIDADGTLALDKRPTVGSDTDRSEESTITYDVSEIGVAVGDVVFTTLDRAKAETTETGEGNPRINQSSDDPLTVEPGEELVVEVTDATPAAGDVMVFIEYVERPFDIDASNATEVDS